MREGWRCDKCQKPQWEDPAFEVGENKVCKACSKIMEVKAHMQSATLYEGRDHLFGAIVVCPYCKNEMPPPPNVPLGMNNWTCGGCQKDFDVNVTTRTYYTATKKVTWEQAKAEYSKQKGDAL